MTIEEIKKAMKDNPALQTQVVIWAKDTTEGKEIMENFAKVEVDKAIKEKTAELYKGIDEDIFEILGERKAREQKSYDYVKTLMTELKKTRDMKPDDKDAKIKELEANMEKMKEEGDVNDYWKGIYDKALETWETKENEYKQTIETKESEFNQTNIGSDLDAGLAGIKFKEGIPKEAIDAVKDARKEKIIKSAKLIDGKVVYHKEDGSPWMNEKTYKPMTASEIWSEQLKALIDDSDNSGGAGGGASKKLDKNGKVVETGEGDNAKKKLSLDPSTFSTKVEFNENARKTLLAQGVDAMDPEFDKMIDAAREEYGVAELPLQ